MPIFGIDSFASPTTPTGSVPLDHLARSNPKMRELVRARPELRKFLASQPAGAIAEGGPGLVTTKVTWNIWSHSPASLHSDWPWRDQFIFIYQKNPGDASEIDFGREGKEDGKLIGVFRLGDLGVEVKRRGAYEGGISSDGGFLVQIELQGLGKLGEKGELRFATGCLDSKGQPTGGWGMGLGYSGRLHEIVNGTPVEAPIHGDDGSYDVLRRGPSGKWEEKTVSKPAGTPGGWRSTSFSNSTPLNRSTAPAFAPAPPPTFRTSTSAPSWISSLGSGRGSRATTLDDDGHSF